MTEELRKMKVGDDAREFTLKNQNGEEISLSDLKSKRVLLSFHPLAWTGICADQMKSLEENREAFESLNTKAFGVSIDSVPSKKAWAESLGIENTSLLADFWPFGEVAKSYDVFRNANGFSERVNIVLDENQKIVFFKVYPLKELPDIHEIIDFLKTL